MELLSLELNENENHEMFNNIKIITNMEESDINIEIVSSDEGNIRIRYFTDDKINKREYIEKIIAKITKLLIEYTKLESINFLKENYCYFDEAELSAIIEDIEDEIDYDVKIQLIIKNKFKEISERSNLINLNGFINFRLKFIKLYSAQIVERCIDSYLMKRDYMDFISIIKLISEVDETSYDVVNVICNNKTLQVYDSNMKKLTYITNEEFAAELDNKVAYNETVINILLSVSPKKIILHEANLNNGNKEVQNTIEIIKKIFEGKIEICSGCKYCNLLQ